MDCQGLPLWGRWQRVSADGEGEDAENMTTFCVETRKTMNAYLLLANGMVFAGQSVGAQGVTVGEVVNAPIMVV